MSATMNRVISLVVLIMLSIYLCIFSGFCQKLTFGCAEMGSVTSKLSLASIGVTIGMLVSSGFPMLTKLLCSLEGGSINGIGTMIFLAIFAAIILISSIMTMNIYDKKLDAKGGTIDKETQLTSIFMNNILFVGIAAGMLYTIFINLVTQAIGRKPVMIAGITIIPVVIFTMVLGIMSMIVYDKNKNDAGKCDKFDTNIPDLSGIGAMFMDGSKAPPPPRPAVLGMTIGAGVFAILVGVAMYLTKGMV